MSRPAVVEAAADGTTTDGGTHAGPLHHAA